MLWNKCLSIRQDLFITAAIYLDGGRESARRFVQRIFAKELKNPDQIAVINNPKGELQELLQSQSGETPKYDLLSSIGPDHNRKFQRWNGI